MKKAFLLLLLFATNTYACYIDESLKTTLEANYKNPTNVKFAATTFVTDWAKTMEFFITFDAIVDGEKKSLAGIASFGQTDCLLQKSDFQVLIPFN